VQPFIYAHMYGAVLENLLISWPIAASRGWSLPAPTPLRNSNSGGRVPGTDVAYFLCSDEFTCARIRPLKLAIRNDYSYFLLRQSCHAYWILFLLYRRAFSFALFLYLLALLFLTIAQLPSIISSFSIHNSSTSVNFQFLSSLELPLSRKISNRGKEVYAISYAYKTLKKIA
jgi:hypothetical protein